MNIIYFIVYNLSIKGIIKHPLKTGKNFVDVLVFVVCCMLDVLLFALSYIYDSPGINNFICDNALIGNTLLDVIPYVFRTTINKKLKLSIDLCICFLFLFIGLFSQSTDLIKASITQITENIFFYYAL